MPTIQEQMDANSAAWHNATTQEEKDRLHQENVKLASQLDSNATFDSGTGKWSGTSDSSVKKTSGSASYNTDPSYDYTTAIKNAIANGASIDYINKLNAERNAKIAASNGALDKYANDTSAMIKEYENKIYNPVNPYEDATEYLKQMYAAQKEQALADLKSQYNESRNNIAAQSALANNMFNEQAIAAGLNTGASGQAALARSATQRSDLASLDEAYLKALQSAQSESDNALTQALYQELVRQQNLEAQKQSEANELAIASAGNTPVLTAAQAKSAYDSGLRTKEVLEAYDYYYGTDYANGGTFNATQETKDVDRVSYNNGSLTREQIMNLQRRLNTYLDANNQIAVDGYWGPATQAAANGMSADDYYEAVYIENTRNKNLGAR